MIRHLKDERHTALLVDSAPQLLLTFWIHGQETSAAMSFVALGTHTLASCPAERIPQLLLDLVSFQPSWGTSSSYAPARSEFLAKLLADIPSRTVTSGDAVEFSERHWVPVSLFGPDEGPKLVWVTTPHRGMAILKDHRYASEIILASDPNESFWELLLETSTGLVKGQRPRNPGRPAPVTLDWPR